jgi:hypothetical protein
MNCLFVFGGYGGATSTTGLSIFNSSGWIIHSSRIFKWFVGVQHQ